MKIKTVQVDLSPQWFSLHLLSFLSSSKWLFFIFSFPLTSRTPQCIETTFKNVSHRLFGIITSHFENSTPFRWGCVTESGKVKLKLSFVIRNPSKKVKKCFKLVLNQSKQIRTRFIWLKIFRIVKVILVLNCVKNSLSFSW